MYYYIVFYIMTSIAQSAGKEAQMHLGYPIANLLNCENIPEGTTTAFFTYGRFQPGHKGHFEMIMTMLAKAEEENVKTRTEITPEKTNVIVFVSPSGGPKEKDHNRNPLTPDEKVHLLQQQYADYPIHFVNMGEAQAKGKNAGPGGAVNLLKECYANAVMFVGGDRIGAFDWLGNKMNIDFEGIERPEGAMSSTSLRKAATTKHQTRQQTSIFENAIKFGAVTKEHAEEIKQMILDAHSTKGGKKRRKTRRKTRRKRKTRKRKKKKTRRKRKRKRRRTRKKVCRFR